ncbi:unnamed protein product [Adineta steineri]|uniref:Uncharacterized protein n=1 Tax=Adineta steineri TaxID=433720 RepID=A0A814W2M6_9BILA|nr:unnamed protein product [Adineta steineri]CAF1196788.1 unnamed protein product [Adineta steineri]CAF3530062.1 unnamed protein product [Adineta steineri]CAF3543114.1 unnamed protein product [Adineta steineri]
MHTNQAFIEYEPKVTVIRKCWRNRRTKIVTSVIGLIIVAVILALLLKFVAFAPNKSDTITSITTSSSTTTSLTITSVPQTTTTAVPQTTTTAVSETTIIASTSISITTITTTQQLGKLYSNTLQYP